MYVVKKFRIIGHSLSRCGSPAIEATSCRYVDFCPNSFRIPVPRNNQDQVDYQIDKEKENRSEGSEKTSNLGS